MGIKLEFSNGEKGGNIHNNPGFNLVLDGINQNIEQVNVWLKDDVKAD